MSNTDGPAVEDVPARQVALDAIIRQAVERAEQTRSYHATSLVKAARTKLSGDTSDRTMRRASKDAQALGWLEKDYGGWKPGERAKELAR